MLWFWGSEKPKCDCERLLKDELTMVVEVKECLEERRRRETKRHDVCIYGKLVSVFFFFFLLVSKLKHFVDLGFKEWEREGLVLYWIEK